MATADMIERADKKPKAPRRASWETRKDSILLGAMRPSVDNEEDRAEQMIRELALRQHSCPRLHDDAATCEHPDHDEHMADALAALQALGLAAHVIVRYKTCTACNESLPTTDFSPNPRNAGGFRPTCKPCHRSEAARQREAKKRATA